MKHYNLILGLSQLVFSLLDPALASWDPYCVLKILLANSQWGKRQAFKAKTRQQRAAPKTGARRKKLAFPFFSACLDLCGVFCLFLNVVFKNSHSWGEAEDSACFRVEHISSSPRDVGVHYRSVPLCLHISPSISYLCAKQTFKTLAGSVKDGFPEEVHSIWRNSITNRFLIDSFF